MARRLVPRSATTTATVPWWSWLPRRRYAIVGRVKEADEIPQSLPRKGMIVVGGDTAPTWVAFDCPCPLRHRLLIPLTARRTPHWQLTSWGRPSLYPSVASTHNGIGCHFWLDQGRVRWVREA